jgi:hypothetical protein
MDGKPFCYQGKPQKKDVRSGKPYLLSANDSSVNIECSPLIRQLSLHHGDVENLSMTLLP